MRRSWTAGAVLHLHHRLARNSELEAKARGIFLEELTGHLRGHVARRRRSGLRDLHRALLFRPSDCTCTLRHAQDRLSCTRVGWCVRAPRRDAPEFVPGREPSQARSSLSSPSAPGVSARRPGGLNRRRCRRGGAGPEAGGGGAEPGAGGAAALQAHGRVRRLRSPRRDLLRSRGTRRDRTLHPVRCPTPFSGDLPAISGQIPSVPINSWSRLRN